MKNKHRMIPALLAGILLASICPTALAAPEERIPVIIELQDEPLLMSPAAAELGTAYLHTPAGEAARAALLDKQQAVQAEILAIDNEAEVSWQYTNTVNGFAAEVRPGDLNRLKDVSGVKSVSADVVYNVPEDSDTVRLASDAELTDLAANLSETTYKGEGTVVAVISTGVDVNHEVMVLSDATVPKLDKNAIAAKLENSELMAEDSVTDLNVDAVYKNEKFPFCFDYADKDTDVTADKNDQGVNVAGVISANYTAAASAAAENSTTLHTVISVNGVAPEAQILGMKVTSSESGSASVSGSIAAVEDAVALGADVICYPMVSPAGFTMYEGEELKAYEFEYSFKAAREAGVLVMVAAGDDDSVGYGSFLSKISSNAYNYTYTRNPDSGLLGNPATKFHATAVADCFTGKTVAPYIALMTSEDEQKLAFRDGNDDNGIASDFMKKLGEGSNKTWEYVYCDIGDESDLAGKELSGKLALVERGTLAFEEKRLNCQTAGAAGVIVFNSEAYGDDLTNPLVQGVKDEDIPLILISRTDGMLLRDAETKAVTVDAQNKECVFDYLEEREMSTNSSWGPTTDLKLKPELTAPGTNTYTTASNNTYRKVSGTNTAAAHAAGVAALMQQYAKANWNSSNFTPEQTAIVIESLMMSTADILTVEKVGQYSPRKQGAGRVNVEAATASDVYLLNMSTGKAKVELGDKVEPTFTVSFDAFNLSDTAHTYSVSGSVLTDSAFVLTLTKADSLTLTMPDSTSIGSCETKEVIVPAGGKTTVSVEIQLNSALLTKLAEWFPNGYFVEGFVTLTDKDGSSPTLSIPYLGFRGDWNAAPIVDGSYYYQLLDNGNNFFYVGAYAYGSWADVNVMLGRSEVDPQGNRNYDFDWIAFSPNGDTYLDSMGYYAYLLRSAKQLTVTIEDSEGNTVKSLQDAQYVTKSTYDTANGATMGEYLKSWDGKDQEGNVMPEGQYQYVISATLDYPGAMPQVTKIPVKLDVTKPVLSALALDPATMQLTGKAQDNTYVTYIFVEDDASDNTAEKVLVDLVPTDEFTLDLREFGGKSFDITVMDVAGNELTQHYTYSPPGSQGGAPSTVSVPTTTDAGSVNASATVSGGTARISLTDTQLERLFTGEQNTGAVQVNVSGLKADAAQLPAKLVAAAGDADGAQGLEISFAAGSLRLSAQALKGMGEDSITVSVKTIAPSALNQTQKDSLGEAGNSALIVDVTVMKNNEKVTRFDGPLTLILPYTPKDGEDPSKLAVYHLAEDGTLSKMNGRYDAEKQAFVFTTDHLSRYVLLSAPAAYDDVTDGDWFYEDVLYVAEKGLMLGTGDTVFAPHVAATRGMVVTLLYRLEGEPTIMFVRAPDKVFSDIEDGAWYEKAVQWAQLNGIAEGCEDGTFRPNDPVSREQLAVLLYRFARHKQYDTAQGGMAVREYTDSARISPFAEGAMTWAVSAGLIQGDEANALLPRGGATRAQTAAIFHRFAETIVKPIQE